MSIRLGVNIDHIATLRQVRGNTTKYPNLIRSAEVVVQNGADQITVHLREDRRHIQDQDVIDLCQSRPCPINLELAMSEDIFNLALEYQPNWLCFVPEKREELTTEGGLDVKANQDRLSSMVAELNSDKTSASMFIEPDLEQVKASHAVGAKAVEFHTGKWVGLEGEERKQEWLKLEAAARLAYDLKLGVHAGHGLDYQSTKEITSLVHLEEVNIGHSIICYSIFEGLDKVIQNYRDILD